MSAREIDVDYAGLAEFLSALAYPTRLELLRILRFPHAIGDIRVAPLRVEAGDHPDRLASKQTVQAHLDKLVDADLVRVEPNADPARRGHVYTVNSQKVYAITEDLRKVSSMVAGRGGLGDVTGTLGHGPSDARAVRGPRLVLVHGLYEGKAFALEGAPEEGWLVGRRRGIAISLDYDPYVSLENSRLRAKGKEILIEDHPESKNGTTVNWEPVAKARPRVLKAGDVVGVGRSLLVFTRD